MIQLPLDDLWKLACDLCHGEGEISVPTFPGSETVAKRKCPRCKGSGIDPEAEKKDNDKNSR